MLQFSLIKHHYPVSLCMNLIFTIDSINDACKKVFDAGKGYKVWAFYGDMGAGKTTFIYHLCNILGVTSTISSPTYSIINEYSCGDKIIYHMDWYRLKDEREAIETGIEDHLYSGRLCLVEWPQKAEALLPEDHFKIILESIDFDKRKISFVP